MLTCVEFIRDCLLAYVFTVYQLLPYYNDSLLLGLCSLLYLPIFSKIMYVLLSEFYYLFTYVFMIFFFQDHSRLI